MIFAEKPDFCRRVFLTSSVGLLACPALRLLAQPPERRAVVLSREHFDAVNRQRRIVVQYDAWSQLGHDFEEWLDYRFDYIDEPGAQIDSVWWDVTALGNATYPSKVLEQLPQAGKLTRGRSSCGWITRSLPVCASSASIE